MDLGSLAPLALLLLCPVAMFLMMRGGGHGRSSIDAHGGQPDHMTRMSDEQLHELAARTDRELKEREARVHGQA